MNKRTRLLAFAALGLAGLIVLFAGLRASIVRPLRTIDDQIVQLRLKLQSVDGERKAYLAADDQVRAAAPTLFGATAEAAEARLGTLLTTLLQQTGLRESDFSRVPAARRRLPGAEEVGWTVQGEGTTAQLVDLLYLLQSQPQRQRVDSLALSPANEGRRLRIRFRYLTPVLNPAPPIPPNLSLPNPTLDSTNRRPYDAIARRDLLRPFDPDSTPPPASRSPEGPGPSPGEDSQLRVVSLSSWGTPPEAHLLDTRTQQTRALRPGDALLDGTLAAIDYRPLPAPGKAGLLAYSRLILKRGEEFWAVDNGQLLSDRRRFNLEDLPASLAPTAPAATNAPTQPSSATP